MTVTILPVNDPPLAIDDWAETVARIREVIWVQKFEGAASNLMNGNLIARDLGLSEKTEIGGIGGPIEIVTTIIDPKEMPEDED